MGVFDKPNYIAEDLKKDKLDRLNARKDRITREIGELFVDDNLDRDMSGTKYEKLFMQLEETDEEIRNLSGHRIYMKCPYCGREIKESSNFCPKCGRTLSSFPLKHSDKKAAEEDSGNSKVYVPDYRADNSESQASDAGADNLEPQVSDIGAVNYHASSLRPGQRKTVKKVSAPSQNLIPEKDPFQDGTPVYIRPDRLLVIGLVCALLVVTIVIVAILSLIHSKNNQLANVITTPGSSQTATNDGPSIDSILNPEDGETQTGETDLAQAVDKSQEFEISTESMADYGKEQVLSYAQYKTYDSGIGSFKFGYPSSLYNRATVIENADGSVYGKILQQVSLEASDGSTATFTVYQNEIGSGAGDSTSDMTDYVLQCEKSHYFTPVIKVNGGGSDGDSGTVLFTAYKDGNPGADFVYDLSQVSGDKIYNMTLTYPRPNGSVDDKNKAYYADTMYRLCSFSGSAKATPYSYDDFIEKNYTNFELTDAQKQILWGIAELNVEGATAAADPSERYVTTGTRNEIAASLANNRFMLEWYNSAGLAKDISMIDKENVNDKVLLKGGLDYAKTFYRDMFGLEVNTDILLQDGNTDTLPSKPTLLYSKDYSELVSVYSDVVYPGGDGPDDYDYNKELQCFNYHMGPVYGMTAEGESWESHRDNLEAGYGIYVAHVRPYMNNSTGFEFLGIERVE